MSNGPNLGVIINATTGDSYDSALRLLLRTIDVLLQGAVISKSLSSPPGSPANGDRYIVATSPSGGWSSFTAGDFVVWTTDDPAAPSGKWEDRTPKNGWAVYNIADKAFYVWNGAAWVPPALATYTVAGLPASPAVGSIAYASDGVKHGESTGGGTGCPVYFSNSQWRRYSDDTQVIS